MPPRFLDQYFDPVLEVDIKTTPDAIAAAERARVENELAKARVAAAIPRRLSEAGREELALDKRRSRRVAHVYSQCVRSWDGELEAAPTIEQRQQGAQVDWVHWWSEQEPWLTARLRYVATWAKRTSHLAVGKQMVVRLKNELDWLQYAMRD